MAPQMEIPTRSPIARRRVEHMDPFLKGYLSAAFWSVRDDDYFAEKTLEDMQAQAVVAAIRVCRWFELRHNTDLAFLAACRGYDAFTAGIDFWLERNTDTLGFRERVGPIFYRRFAKILLELGEIRLGLNAEGQVIMERDDAE